MSNAVTVGISPMVRVPLTTPTAAVASAAARSAESRLLRAQGRNASPAAVSSTRRLDRAKRGVPISSSSLRTWWLSADCTTKHC